MYQCTSSPHKGHWSDFTKKLAKCRRADFRNTYISGLVEVKYLDVYYDLIS